MKKASPPDIDLARAVGKLRAWRKKYDTPEKIAALHRKAILQHVVQSMDFEGQPVSMARLKALLKRKKVEAVSLHARGAKFWNRCLTGSQRSASSVGGRDSAMWFDGGRSTGSGEDAQTGRPTRPQGRRNRRRSLMATLRILLSREQSWGVVSASD